MTPVSEGIVAGGLGVTPSLGTIGGLGTLGEARRSESGDE